MSIANPTTYAEWYWANQVDANKAFADEEEKTLAPFMSNLLSLVGELEGFPPEVAGFLRAVGTPGHFGLSDVAKQTLGQSGSQSITSGLTPFLRSLGYAANKKFPSALIDFPTTMLLAQRRKAIPELFTSRAESNGYKEAEARLFYDASLPYPDISDWLRYFRYTKDATDTITQLQTRQDIPDDEYAVWEWLNAMLLSLNDVQALFVRGYMDYEQAHLELRRNGWNDMDAAAMLDLAFAIPNPAIRVQAGLLQNESDEQLTDRITQAGIHPEHATDFLNALLAKPNPQDIIRWRLRSDPSLSDLPTDLRRIGVHPEYLDVYKTLAFPVPPVGDMITMAVREAFSPDIARRFGQYEDYPTELTKYAAMNGISKEWAERYWAAHWSLPSPQQGFEMLHRGIITNDELQLLMRALDIMPFWRDKLIQAAYKPLTRVDVRRMFGLGVLSENEVLQAYKDVGYSDVNAKRLTEFTVKQVLATQTGFNSQDVVGAYKNSRVGRSEAYTMLGDLGLKGNNITQVLNAAETQRDWTILQDNIKAIGNEYRQDQITLEEAKASLLKLRLPADKVEALGGQWYKETVSRVSTPWTKAEVVQFMAKGIINQQRAVQELKILGYDSEHINAIIANAAQKKAK